MREQVLLDICLCYCGVINKENLAADRADLENYATQVLDVPEITVAQEIRVWV